VRAGGGQTEGVDDEGTIASEDGRGPAAAASEVPSLTRMGGKKQRKELALESTTGRGGTGRTGTARRRRGRLRGGGRRGRGTSSR
jgi:hypothetical protein